MPPTPACRRPAPRSAYARTGLRAFSRQCQPMLLSHEDLASVIGVTNIVFVVYLPLSFAFVNRRTSVTAALKAPYLLFLGAAPTLADAKTAAGIAHWRHELCCGQLRLPGCKADTGLPDLDLETARARGARSLIIGVAPMGGQFEPTWIEVMQRAARLGYDIVSGMHTKLGIDSGTGGARRDAWRAIDRRARAARGHQGGHRRQTHGPPLADGRHRLRRRQEIYGARASIASCVHRDASRRSERPARRAS